MQIKIRTGIRCLGYNYSLWKKGVLAPGFYPL
jgi:hypothetical protein